MHLQSIIQCLASTWLHHLRLTTVKRERGGGERKSQREWDRETDRQTDGQRQRQTQRETETEREREGSTCWETLSQQCGALRWCWQPQSRGCPDGCRRGGPHPAPATQTVVFKVPSCLQRGPGEDWNQSKLARERRRQPTATLRLHCYWEPGSSLLVEHQTRDWKLMNSSPGRSSWGIFFYRVNFWCWLL